MCTVVVDGEVFALGEPYHLTLGWGPHRSPGGGRGDSHTHGNWQQAKGVQLT